MKNILGSVAFEEISEKTLTCRLHRMVANKPVMGRNWAVAKDTATTTASKRCFFLGSLDNFFQRTSCCLSFLDLLICCWVIPSILGLPVLFPRIPPPPLTELTASYSVIIVKYSQAVINHDKLCFCSFRLLPPAIWHLLLDKFTFNLRVMLHSMTGPSTITPLTCCPKLLSLFIRLSNLSSLFKTWKSISQPPSLPKKPNDSQPWLPLYR